MVEEGKITKNQAFLIMADIDQQQGLKIFTGTRSGNTAKLVRLHQKIPNRRSKLQLFFKCLFIRFHPRLCIIEQSTSYTGSWS